MSEVRLSAERRTEFGKGGARRTRRAGKIPAVLYGHGADPQHLSLPAREFANAVRHGGANVLLTLDVDGTAALAIPKSIQRHVIKGTFDHVDLLAVRRGEKITIDVALVLTGEIAPGGLLQQENNNVSVEAEATHIPTEFELSVEGLQVGEHRTAADLPLPAGVTLVSEPDTMLVLVSEAPSAEALEAEMEEAAAELGIEQDQPETEAPAEGAEAESVADDQRPASE